MFSLINIKKNFILILFSISIFFSYVDFFFLELRFLYLFSILLIFFDKNFFNRSNKNIIYISLVLFLFLLAHFVLNNTISFNANYLENSLKNFLLAKSFLQVFVISISVFLIYYKQILLLNLKKYLIIFLFYLRFQFLLTI